MGLAEADWKRRGVTVTEDLRAAKLQEIWVRSLRQKDPLEKETATPSTILAWRIPMDREAWRACVHAQTETFPLT